MRPAALLAALALAACGRATQPPAAPALVAAPASASGAVNPDPGVRAYRCDDGTVVRAGYPDATTAVIDVGGHAYTLKAAVAASGVRYTGLGLQWWTKGLDQARLARLEPGETIASAPGVACRTEAEPAPPAPFTAASPQGAAQVVQTYYALIESGRYAEAWRLWSDGGRASGLDEAAFAASFKGYASYHAQVGAPGEIEGAAGSLYVEVPVTAYGQRKGGAAFSRKGKVTLRRVNDVPGSTAEQRRWHIAGIALR